MRKIAIVGAGRVGETTAQILAEEQLCREIALFDVRADIPQGVALDIDQTAPFFAFDCSVSGSNDPQILRDSDLVVIAAGLSFEPEASRSDLLGANVRIVDEVCGHIIRYAPNAMVLVVTNPVDILTYRVAQRTGWGRSRVFGQAGVLDASRMASFIAQETGFSALDITTMVLGGHGDAMVPLPRFCTINGIPISTFMAEGRIQAIVERTRGGGEEIFALRKNSSAYDAPGAAVAAMVDAIAHNRRRLLPCVALLEGEYGESGVAIGVPCVLAEKGIETIVELDLDEREREAFERATAAARAAIEGLGEIL